MDSHGPEEGVESVGDGDAGNFRVPNSSPHDGAATALSNGAFTLKEKGRDEWDKCEAQTIALVIIVTVLKL